MKLHRVLEQSFETFQEQSEAARVTLLHPRSRYRSLLVARLINSSEFPAFYYALGPDDINLSSFLSGITHDLANQHPTFGRHLNMLPSESESNLNAIITTFARDIGELSEKPFYLILDEYDRSDEADDIQMFIEKLTAHLPEHCKLIINSRTLPRLPWVSMIARGDAVIIEDEQVIRRDFYEIQGKGSKMLEVYALGPGFVLLNDQPIDSWEGHLPRLLFFFALDRPVITRSEICQAFWPELDMDQAVNVFHVTKRRLHKALDMDVLVHDEGYYRVNPDLDIYYDVMHYVAHLMDARDQRSSNTLAAWQRTIDLYRGPFLQGHNDGWIQDRRADFRAGYLEALMNMAQYRLAEDRPEHALSLYQRALSEDNQREDLHREVMNLFSKLGRRSEAAAHYQRLCDDFGRAGIVVSDETNRLYQQIMTL
jgi:DNA-binding SARP family transcriptional activator